MAHNRRSHRDEPSVDSSSSPLSRRGFLTGAGAAGLAAAASPLAVVRSAKAAAPDGTPEQIHLTWGEDPTRSVVVSWASAAQAINPRVHHGDSRFFGSTLPAVQRTYTDGLNGQTVFTYHARLEGLRPDSLVHYSVTADNDSNGNQPFTATFRTAPRGRVPFRWTSYGDSSDAGHGLGPLLAPERLRGASGRAVRAALPSTQRRPLLREPEPDRAARGMGRLRQQQPGLRRRSVRGCLAREPRD